jgi:hypothetical protein
MWQAHPFALSRQLAGPVDRIAQLIALRYP